jgi:hypothetical protein
MTSLAGYGARDGGDSVSRIPYRSKRSWKWATESEARIIRSAIEGWLESLLPRPRSSMLGTIEFGDPELPFKVDEILAGGFGLQ